MKPALHQKSPLEAESRDQEVESDGTETVALQEGHEEPKAHEDHDMNILKTCRKNTIQSFKTIVKINQKHYSMTMTSIKMDVFKPIVSCTNIP